MRFGRIYLIPVLVFISILCSSRKPGLQAYRYPNLDFFPPVPEIPDNPTTVEGADLGKKLFYDQGLSLDSSISCSSCHQQQYAFSDATNQFSKGISGKNLKRNTLPLFNLLWKSSFFADGKAVKLEDAISHPILDADEMGSNWELILKRLNNNQTYRSTFLSVFNCEHIDSIVVKKSIAQFLRTLVSSQSKYDSVIFTLAVFNEEEELGFKIMNDQNKGNCLHCHVTDGNRFGTTLQFSNNGLDSVTELKGFKDAGRGNITRLPNDNGKFMIPSLRNIAVTAPYMHDGRFKTLEEVMDFYNDGLKYSPTIDSRMEFNVHGGSKLSAQEKKAIIAFLHTMTDSHFLSCQEYQKPK